MKLVRTIKIKLQEHPKIFQPTIDAYTKAFNHTCQVGRREHSSWSYYQLEEFLKYKSAYAGVLVAYVSACYTSREV